MLAVVSGDPAFAAATRADDLYAPVAAAGRGAAGRQGGGARGDVRPAQRRGREALGDLERAYPVAMALLDRAYASGVARAAAAHVRGAVPTGPRRAPWAGSDRRRPGPVRAQRDHPGGGGRAVQGVGGDGAARHAPTWAPRSCCACTTSCWCTRPEEHAAEVAGASTAPRRRARRWAGTAHVRFVADTSVIARWSDAKEGRSGGAEAAAVLVLALVVLDDVRGSPRSRRRARRPTGARHASVASRLGRWRPSMNVSYCCSSAVTTARASSLPSTSRAMACWFRPAAARGRRRQVEAGDVDHGVEGGERALGPLGRAR